VFRQVFCGRKLTGDKASKVCAALQTHGEPNLGDAIGRSLSTSRPFDTANGIWLCKPSGGLGWLPAVDLRSTQYIFITTRCVRNPRAVEYVEESGYRFICVNDLTATGLCVRLRNINQATETIASLSRRDGMNPPRAINELQVFQATPRRREKPTVPLTNVLIVSTAPSPAPVDLFDALFK